MKAETIEYTTVDYDPFAEAPMALARVVPSTEPQREVWLANRLSREASLAYNESVTLRLRGALNPNALMRAVQALVARHESFRATFGADGTTMCIADSLVLDVPTLYLDEPSEAPRDQNDTDGAVADLLRDEVEHEFDLENGPLFRARLIRLAAGDHMLVLTAHHIVCDGWSFGIVVEELGQLYVAEMGEAPDLAPAASFSDYAVAQIAYSQTPEWEADAAYWARQFSSVPAPLELPTDRPRRARRSFASERLDVSLDAELVSRLRQFGARRGANLYSVLLGTFAISLQRLGAQQDMVIGVPTAGQSDPEFGSVVGHCVNLLPLRLLADPQRSIGELATATQAAMLDAFEHRNFTFGTLLKRLVLARDPSRPALVSVMFNLDQALDTTKVPFGGLSLEFHGNPRTHENFELFVNAVQANGGLRLECQYNSDLFDRSSVSRWMLGYEALLRAGWQTPDTPSGDIAFVGADDVALLRQWNDTARALPRDQTVHGMFEAQARATPDHVALVSGDVQLSYRALDARAEALAAALRGRGVARGALVGLCVERGPDMLAAMLAILKAGAAYVPLDPAYPADRLSYMVEDAGLTLLVSDSALAAGFDWPRERTLLLDLDVGLDTHQVDMGPNAGAASIDAESAAYVIYTSGSTGKPKGVVVPHRSVVNYLASMAREPGLASTDTLVAVTTLSFDIAVTELLLPLTVGARIVLAGRDEVTDPAALRALIERHRANVMQATPATWRMLLDAGWIGTPGFKALCGGEPLVADLARQLVASTAAVWNMYGPTETTVWSTGGRVTSQSGASIDIGKPIANTQVWIVDGRGQLCPIGVPGEILIGGDGVTLGYLNRPELTAERFVADTFSAVTPGNPAREARLYRTGDRGRWRNDGVIEHLGRNDHQVKVRGYRIEPGEIEAALLADPEVARCVVLAREDRPGDVRLVAYLVLKSGGVADEASLRALLRRGLPEYMVPQHFIALKAIPLLPNGKVDRHGLPAPSGSTAPKARFELPRNAQEQLVARAMEVALCLPGLGAHDNFFSLGGHSLLAAQVATSLGKSLGRRVPLRAVFDAPTVAELALWLDAAATEPAATELPPMRREVFSDRAPTSLMQQRVYFMEQVNPGRATYNTPAAFRLTGALQVDALERSLNRIIERQGVLRTAIVDEDGTPVQRILPSLTISLRPLVDLSGVDTSRRESELHALLQAEAAKPIELRTAPLFRTALYKLGDEEHVLFFMTHHAIWDGWSFDLFHDEMAALYGSFSRNREPNLSPVAATYGDYARWQQQWLRSDDLRHQIAHWSERLANLPEPLALALDKPRPAVMSGNGRTQPVSWPLSLAERCRSFGTQHDATLFMTLLAGYALLLHRLSGQREIVVGTPVRGRNAPEVQNVMGFFVNALPIRLYIDPEHDFVELLGQVRHAVLDAFAAPDVPIEQLIRKVAPVRDESRSPIYQAFFSYQDARERRHDWGSLKQSQVHVFQTGSADDLGLWFLDHGEGLAGGLSYNTDLFEATTASRMAVQLQGLLTAALDDPRLPVHLVASGVADEVAIAARATAAIHELPKPAMSAGAGPSATPRGSPLTEAQQRVARIWQQALGIDRVDASDNFFDLGGHSLLASRVASQLESRYGMKVHVRRLIFESLAQIAATPCNVGGSDAPQEPARSTGGLLARVLGRFGRRS